MNRILFETGEITDGIATCGGERAEHILNILHGEVGQILKTGEIDGPIGSGEIVGISRIGEPPVSSLASSPSRLPSPVSRPVVTVRVRHTDPSLQPWCDLVLAPPRPRVMKRLLPQLATLGVGTIVLVGAQKTEKDFWGATLLKEQNCRPLLIDGLMQAGTSVLPKLVLRRNFKRFVRDELETLFPTANRLVAHPYLKPGTAPAATSARPLFAVGPEGGWTDEEVALLEAHGFRGVTLGPRILKTDTAVIALLARHLPEEVAE